jgi:hypothetical protein
LASVQKETVLVTTLDELTLTFEVMRNKTLEKIHELLLLVEQDNIDRVFLKLADNY